MKLQCSLSSRMQADHYTDGLLPTHVTPPQADNQI